MSQVFLLIVHLLFAAQGVMLPAPGNGLNSGGGGVGTALTTCGSISTAGPYYFANNITCPGTGFSVLASNVTVNQAGYTLTYGNAANTKIVAGYLGIACYETLWTGGKIDTTTGACSSGSTFQNFTVYGGTITQGCTPATTCLPQDSNPVFMDSYFSGNGSLSSGPTVHDMTITWACGDCLAISTNYGNSSVPGGAKVYNDVFNNNKNGPVCAMVSCRSSLQGTSVIIGNAVATSIAPQLYNNQCLGGPQGCMMSDALNASFTNNSPVNPGAASVEYTNDFGIYAWACGDTVTGNTIGTNPPTGNQATRGISIDLVEFPSGCAGNTTVSSNTVNVITSTNNAEYGGCSIGGVYGIQIDDGGMNATISGNTVNAFSKSCASAGLRLTDIGTGNKSTGNTYSAHVVSGSGFTPTSQFPTTGVYIDGQPSFPVFTSVGDTFLGDGSAVAVDSNGCGPMYFETPTLGSGTNPVGFVTFSFWNNSGTGNTCTGLHFVDPTFTGSATATSTNMKVGNNAPYELAQYFIQWTYSGTVTGFLSGAPVSGAAVVVTGSSASGSGTECSTTTSASGAFSCTGTTAVTQLDMKNSTTVAQINTNHNPHSVVVSKSGCTTNTSALTITSTTTGVSIVLGGC
jgi:hypothetical protein